MIHISLWSFAKFWKKNFFTSLENFFFWKICSHQSYSFIQTRVTFSSLGKIHFAIFSSILSLPLSHTHAHTYPQSNAHARTRTVPHCGWVFFRFLRKNKNLQSFENSVWMRSLHSASVSHHFFPLNFAFQNLSSTPFHSFVRVIFLSFFLSLPSYFLFPVSLSLFIILFLIIFIFLIRSIFQSLPFLLYSTFLFLFL